MLVRLGFVALRCGFSGGGLTGSGALGDEIDGEMPDNGHVFRAVAFAQAGLVVDGHVQHPMELVLDAPMAAHRLGRLFGGEGGRGDVIARLEAAALGKLGARFHADDRRARAAGATRRESGARH